jgi:hypothetical protein
MIQRIQSVFLLLAVIVQTVFIFLPLAYFVSPDMDAQMLVSGVVDDEGLLMTTISLFILSILIVLISLATLFLYKKRTVQMFLCIDNIILNLGLIAVIVVLAHYFSKSSAAVSSSYSWAIIMPGISAILHALAFRAIRKDENLVKSQERLR